MYGLKTNTVMCLTTAAVVLVAGCRQTQTARQLPPARQLTNDVVLSYTPVKSQGTSHFCWIYAMLATIESEHIARGDSVNLSPAYVARMLLRNEAARHYFSCGSQPIRMRGMCSMLPALLEKNGVVPYDAFEGAEEPNYRVLGRKLAHQAYLNATRRCGLRQLYSDVDQMLDRDIGPVPRKVFMLGAEYTPVEFAHSVCLPREYVAFTSFTHQPFFRPFVLEVPDNLQGDTFMNLPLALLIQLMERSVRRGHPVCWEGDISEAGFSFERGVAVLPDEGTPVTQQTRQRAFETLQTTDDHAMAIVGLAHDEAGRKYFIAKNSWGAGNPYGGLMYLSYNYVKQQTIAVFLSRNALEVR